MPELGGTVPLTFISPSKGPIDRQGPWHTEAYGSYLYTINVFGEILQLLKCTTKLKCTLPFKNFLCFKYTELVHNHQIHSWPSIHSWLTKIVTAVGKSDI